MILFLGFKFTECKTESWCEFLMSTGAGVGATFWEQGQVSKKWLRSPLVHARAHWTHRNRNRRKHNRTLFETCRVHTALYLTKFDILVNTLEPDVQMG